MEIRGDIRQRLLEFVGQSPGCDVEQMLSACPDLTWNQVFLGLDCLSRSGAVALKQERPGCYSVVAATEKSSNLLPH
ncbi:MAG: hypothetical protein NTNFB02_15590 [Nitrospira sp.]